MSAPDEAGRDPFARYRERLAAVGFRPRRRHGQNFLLDAAVHEAVADAAGVGTGDVVLEVGGGLGFLTRVLAARAGQVVCVELDPRLAGLLAEELAALPGARGARVRLLVGDVLAAGGALAAPVGAALDEAWAASGRCGALRVAANLPYAISGPLLAALLSAPLPAVPAGMGLLVQREFAERLAAAPGTPEYGGLSVLAQSAYAVRRGRTVSRAAFRPRPNVDSALVALSRRDEASSLAAAPAAERRLFAGVVRAAFAQRRKVLRHALERIAARYAIELPVTEAERGARAEQLSAGRWVELWRGRRALE